MAQKLFIFGAGYSGNVFAHHMCAAGWQVAGTTRSADKARALESDCIRGLVFDGKVLTEETRSVLCEASHLLVSIAPMHGMNEKHSGPPSVDPVLDAAGETIRAAMPRLEWIGYWSTVGVYGDHDGAWVDEEAECRPTSKRGRMRVEAEAQWLALGREMEVPVAIMRLAGIYGPGRNPFVKLGEGKARRIVKPGLVFSRIHVDDIAGATEMLALRGLGGIFNICDDEPAPPQDVIAHAASLMGVEPPPEIPFEEAEMTPMARSFYGDNRRVSNAKLKAAGYELHHPDYRGSLERMWREGSWR
jgi:nucleoside-diphosphate-sugar epimerase